MRWVVNATPRPLDPRERPGTHCIEGWVGPRAGLDGYEKSRPHRDSIPGPSSPYRVAIPNELSRPLRILAGYNLNSTVLRRTSWRSMGTVEQSNILCDLCEAGNRIERSHCLVYLYHEDTFKVVNLLFSPTHYNKILFITTPILSFSIFLLFCPFFSSERVKEDRLDDSIDVCARGLRHYAKKLI